jgi:regulator of sirC expression with transglutaminase-like and TPR domain
MSPEPETLQGLRDLLRSATPPDPAAAALQLVRLFRPGVDPTPTLSRIDRFAGDILGRLGEGSAPSRRARALDTYLFEELGFAGNTDDYQDPRNSFLDQVVERRLGIPISLAVLYLAVGRRLGIDVAGVGFPGHFLVRVRDDTGTRFLDAFNGGQVLDDADLDARLGSVFGGAAPKVASNPSLLRPATPIETSVRMLRNLKHTFLRREEHADALIAIEGILGLEPGLAEEIRDRGMLYRALGRNDLALRDLRRYLRATPDAREAAELTEIIDSLAAAAAPRLH